MAEKELNETEAVREKAMADLRAMMDEEEKKGEVKFHRRDDSFLLRYLRNKKFEVERAFAVVKKWAEFRRDHPEIYSNENYSMRALEAAYRTGYMQVLPDPDKFGRAVVLIDVKKVDFHKMDFEAYVACGMYMLEVMLEDARRQVAGAVYIEDIGGLSFKNLMGLVRFMGKRKAMFQETMKDAIPIRIGGIYFMNQPWYLSFLLALIKPTLKKKMKDRFHVYGNSWDKLYERLMPKEHLPPNFGGTKELHPDDFIEYAKKIEAGLKEKGITL
uniref:CRAL-TRIO domain-containing protein n=1 Tax=Palpitomonas bilix TaxID=652834 RepID=A0A7S3D3E7_9EUKA